MLIFESFFPVIHLPNKNVIEQISQRNKQHGGRALNSCHAESLLGLNAATAAEQKHVELQSNDFWFLHFSPSAAADVNIYGCKGNEFLQTYCI